MLNPTFTSFYKTLAFSTCFAFFISNNVLAEPNESGIEVRGQASVVVVPDSFTLSIAITEKGRFTDKIRAIVDDKTNQVIDVAKRLGINSKNINTARVSLRIIKKEFDLDVKELEIQRTLPNKQQSTVHIGTKSPANNVRPQYFELTRNITINFSDIKDYDQFLNAIIKIRVSHISPLTMSVENTDKFYQKALLQAIKNAKEKAMQIADVSGKSINELVYVKEISSNHYRGRSSAMMMSTGSSFEHQSQVGSQSISASVLVNYSIK